MEQRATFDTVATLYRDARPGYPKELIEDVIAFAGVKAGDAVLEVGCGAGQATETFAHRGFRFTALDPGAALIRAAQERLGDGADVAYVTGLYEHRKFDAGAFRLIFSAQAWHWIAPEVAFPKAADELAEGGVLAIFGHVPAALPEPLGAAFERTYRRHVGVWAPPPETAYRPSGPFAQRVDASGRFGPVTHKAYAWAWQHTAASYDAFARTRSDHAMLAGDVRDALLADIRDAIDAQGGTFAWRYETHLYMARRR